MLDRRYAAAQIFDEPSTHRGPSGQKRFPRGIRELIDICWGYQLMRGGINELGHVLFDDLKGSRGCLWMFDLIWNLKYFYYYFPIFTRSVSIKAYLFHPKVVGVHKSALCPSAERGGVNYWVTEIWIIIIRWPLKLSINRENDFIKIHLLIIYQKRRHSFDKLLFNQWVGVKPQTKVINQSINYYHCDVIADEIIKSISIKSSHSVDAG